MLQRDRCMAPHSLLQGTSGRGRRARGWRRREELQTEEQRNPKEVLVGEKRKRKTSLIKRLGEVGKAIKSNQAI